MDPKNASPVAWAALLQDAVTKPGTISTAYHMFHGYSLGNQMLAHWQLRSRNITPGPLATFKRWQALGRCVRKGEKAIVLCMPITIKKDKGGTEERFTWFAYKPRWFALSQTEGADYTTTMPAMEWDAFKAERALDISEKVFDLVNGNCMGYAEKRTYAINPMDPHAARTRFHEMAHIVLGHTESEACVDTEVMSRSLKEVEAESVAMILCETLGLGGASEARGYIQHWMGAGNVNSIPEQNAQRIFAAADKILRAGLPEKVVEVVEEEATAAV